MPKILHSGYETIVKQCLELLTQHSNLEESPAALSHLSTSGICSLYYAHPCGWTLLYNSHSTCPDDFVPECIWIVNIKQKFLISWSFHLSKGDLSQIQ